jgi:hypothetical protein
VVCATNKVQFHLGLATTKQTLDVQPTSFDKIEFLGQVGR